MIRSRLLIAGGVGAVLSGLGLLLAELGGWGPCGPASSIAYIGGILNVFHVIFYAEVFGEFGTDYGLVNILLMFFIAALDWAVLAFLVTLVFRRRSRKEGVISNPTDGSAAAGDSEGRKQ